MEPVLEWCAVNRHHLPEHFFHLHGIVKMFASYHRIGKLLLDRYIIFIINDRFQCGAMKLLYRR